MAGPDPIFVLRWGSESPVNFLRFVMKDSGGADLWTASTDGTVRRWCLETMRPTLEIAAHPGVIGGAFWVDGAGSHLFTQGRDGVIKRFIVGNDETPNNVISEERDYGFCACDLLTDGVTNYLVRSLPEGKVRLFTPEVVIADCSPDKSLKLGACMVLKILVQDDTTSPSDVIENPSSAAIKSPSKSIDVNDENSSITNDSFIAPRMLDSTVDASRTNLRSTCRGKETSLRSIVGYEDGSVVVWDLRRRYLLARLILFEGEPVMALDVTDALGFAGSPGNQLISFEFRQKEEDGVSLTRRSETELRNDGLSCLRIRRVSTFPKLLASGGWDHRIRIFTLKSLKPLAVLDAHKKTVRSLDFDPTSGILAAGSDDGHVSLWKLYCDAKK